MLFAAHHKMDISTRFVHNVFIFIGLCQVVGGAQAPITFPCTEATLLVKYKNIFADQ